MIRHIIRGVTIEDEHSLLELARHLNTVNLPYDPAAVREIIELSTRSFSGALKDARRREYVFVLEDLESRRLVGSSKIIAQLGRRDAPYIYFDVIIEEKYSPTLDRHFVHTVLRLGHSYEGPTEIGGLIVLPESRNAPEKLGLMISYVRFMFMAVHRGLFRNEVVAELMPPLLADGRSHLWESLGRKFTDMTYFEADKLSKRNKEFIKSLFPSGDIYASILPQDAQDVIGKVGRETRGVEKMLRRIGFQYCNRIDPFDGGPHFRAATDEIHLVKRTVRGRVRAVDPGSLPPTARALLAANLKDPPYFRALATAARVAQDGVIEAPADIIEALGATAESEFALLPLD
jgi:arginine N-succinyltransferase